MTITTHPKRIPAAPDLVPAAWTVLAGCADDLAAADAEWNAVCGDLRSYDDDAFDRAAETRSRAKDRLLAAAAIYVETVRAAEAGP